MQALADLNTVTVGSIPSVRGGVTPRDLAPALSKRGLLFHASDALLRLSIKMRGRRCQDLVWWGLGGKRLHPPVIDVRHLARRLDGVLTVLYMREFHR